MPATYETIENLKAWANDLGGKCLSARFAGNMSMYTWECGQCDHQWDASWNNVKCHSSWCPECKTSIRETIVRAAFQENFPGEAFAKNQTAIGMELDGYSENNMIAFEHDGIQHRIRVKHFQRLEGEFEAQVQRDSKKDSLCDDNGITLVRIPDRMVLPHSGIRTFVRNIITELGYTVPTDLLSDADFFSQVRAARGESPYLEEVRKIVTEHRGDLLGNQCPTRTWPIHVTCPKDHLFATHYDNLKRGRWCPECAHSAPKPVDEVIRASEALGYTFLYVENRPDNKGVCRKYVTLECTKHEPFEILWDNLKKGRGCQPCGRARAGTTKRNDPTKMEDKIHAMGLNIETEYRTMSAPSVFSCDANNHRFTTTARKLEMLAGDVKCPACIADNYEDVYLMDAYTPETDPVKTILTWCCRNCEQLTQSTWRGMRIRKHRCGNKNCTTVHKGEKK